MPNTLSLPEEILLLALRDEDGNVQSDWIEQTLAGALLAELILAGYINISEDDKQHVSATDKGRPSDPLEAEALDRIASHKRPYSLQDWVSDIAVQLKLMDQVAGRLVDRGILQLEERKILFFFTNRRYPEVDPRPEAAIRERLKDAIINAGSPLDDRTRLLIALARSSRLIRVNLGKDFVEEHEDRIEAILAEDLSGQATLKAVSQAQTAMFVATTMPAITATVVT